MNNTLTRFTVPQGYTKWGVEAEGYPAGYSTLEYNFDFFNYAGIHRCLLDVNIQRDISKYNIVDLWHFIQLQRSSSSQTLQLPQSEWNTQSKANIHNISKCIKGCWGHVRRFLFQHWISLRQSGLSFQTDILNIKKRFSLKEKEDVQCNIQLLDGSDDNVVFESFSCKDTG